MSASTRVAPSPDQCRATLRAAGIDEALTRYEVVPVPDYSVNVICFLNDRYVLRASTVDGERRFGHERDALERLADLPQVPDVIDTGTVMLDEPAHYLLQTRIPGDTVISQWPAMPDDARRELIEGLATLLREIHRRPAEGYVIDHYQSALRGWGGSWLDGHDLHMRQLLEGIRRRPLTAGQAALVAEAEAYYAAHRTSLAYSVGPRVAHGDLHLYNVLSSGRRITGIIDWEWSYGGGSEPDFDLEALFRWALFPRDLGDDDDAQEFRDDDFACVIPTLLASYPEVRAVPRLMERMTIYQIEHELHQMISWPPRVPTRPVERLGVWVREQRLERAYG